MRKTKTKVLALGAVLSALAVVVMMLGGLIPAATFCCPILAGFVLIPVLFEGGAAMALCAWGAAARPAAQNPAAARSPALGCQAAAVQHRRGHRLRSAAVRAGPRRPAGRICGHGKGHADRHPADGQRRICPVRLHPPPGDAPVPVPLPPEILEIKPLQTRSFAAVFYCSKSLKDYSILLMSVPDHVEIIHTSCRV